MPVVDQIERDHRRHHHQREQRDQRAAARPQRLQERGEPAHPLRHQIADRFVGAEARAQEFLQPRPARIAEQRLQPRHIAGDVVDEGRQLAAEDRRHQQDQEDDRHHHQRDDQQRGGQPVDAEAFEPVGDRREQIGDGRAGDERQQDLAQQPQQQHDDGERRQPEHDLPLGRHAVALGRIATRTRPGARAHGPAAVEFMWRTHSAT